MRFRCLTASLACLSLFAVGLPSWSLAAGAGASSVTVDIPIGAYEIREAGGGHELVMEDFGRCLVPGTPGLPSRIFHIAVPPGARVQSVTYDAGESSVLPGEYRIAPVPVPKVVGEENPQAAERERREYAANYAAVYGSDQEYPSRVCELVGQAGYRKYNLAEVRAFPFSYRPLSGELVYHPEVKVTVHYSIPQVIPAGTVLIDNLARTEALARRMIMNYSEAAAWYPESGSPGARGLHDYVIITLESLVSSVEPLVDWEVGKGRTVNVVTTAWINDNYTGYDLAQKMRNFLREKYPSGEWGIRDVCLVGHYDDVPMRRTAQDIGYGQPETDLYFAELSLPDDQSWDDDGDHQWGEDSDPIDFISEVNVGRIPWSTPATVEHICEKTVAYELNSDPDFKKNILLLGAYFWDDTDNAVLMEYKTNPTLHPWMEDWTMTRMYEDAHSIYPCDYDLTNTNVRSVWSNGMYSFVNWAGHGSPTACYILYNGSPYFISSGDCPILNDDYPAIVFADACSNSDTDYLNIGQAMLQKGAIGFLGATKVAYGMPAWNHPNDGSSQSLDYYFTTCCTSGDYTQGEAHQWSLYEMYVGGLWYYTYYEAFEWGALWGNPDLSAGYIPILNILFPNGLPEGRIPPGFEGEIAIQIMNGREIYVPGTGKLHYRMAPEDPYTEVDIVPVGEDLFTATLPATEPGDRPEFYFSAQGDGGTTVYSPLEAPAVVYSFDVCIIEDLVHDDFETDLGWAVEDFQVSAGSWERCVPNTTSGQQISPEEDNPDGTGTYCFVTGNGPPGGSYRDWDVDGGPTILTSPVFDLSQGDADISYYIWHANDDLDDNLEVEISSDGGATWILVEQVMNTEGEWGRRGFAASDFIAPTDQVQVRFKIADSPNNSITEAGLDDFRLTRIDYVPNIWADAYSLSASSGGTITLFLDAGPSYAGREYIVGGSISGAYPGTTLPGGNVIPLNIDPLTRLILHNLNGPVFQGFMGNLDSEGKAQAVLSVPGPTSPSNVGKSAIFAFTLTGSFDFVSNPVFIEIVP
jgi:hypothetical protein